MTVNLKPRLFTVEEYALMIEAGVFAPDERVELIEGEIIAVSPANPPHASRIARLTTVLVRLFGDTHEIRVQLPLTLGLRSEPEPDFALVRLEVADGAARHPAAADLVIEISDSSLRLDRNEKASLYAKAGVMDYWILNLKHHRLEVRRDAWEQEDAVYGWDYATVSLHSPDQRVSPLFAPQIVFEVCDLLGPKS